MKVAFIINGSRSLTRMASEAIQRCRDNKYLNVHVLKTDHARHAIELAQHCSENEIDVVFAVGGDGTVNEVLNGIMHYSGKRPILGILPNGTGNDFVRGTDLNLSLSALTDSILNRNVKSVDVAKVVYTSGARYFLNIADIGFGGKVVQVLDKQRRFIGGKASYALAILRSFLGYRRPELEITCENFQYRGSVLMVAICNGRIFGDGLTINPYAFMNDGKLNITLLGKVTLFDYIRNLSNLKSGKEIRHPEAHYLEASEISVRIINGEAVGELDGEYFPDGNCTFSILPSEIELLNY